jgi:type IV pilus biogenesis protein CpaD/CtpE
MKHVLILASLVAAAFLLAACATSPKVAQGTVVSYDLATKTMVIQDESKPESALTFSLQDAEVGADALPGDTVRVSYLDQDGKMAATRVMNITRQEEVAKKEAR